MGARGWTIDEPYTGGESEHFIAFLPLGDTLAHFRYVAGEFDSKDGGRPGWKRVFSFPLQDVHAVEAKVFNL